MKFGVASEKDILTGATSIDARGLGIRVLAGEGRFGGTFAQYRESQRIDLSAKFRFINFYRINGAVGTQILVLHAETSLGNGTPAEEWQSYPRGFFFKYFWW